MTDDRHGPARQAVSSIGQSAEDGIARQLSELAREMQADLTVEALLQGKAGVFGPQAESDGMLLASHAALAMTAARTRAGLLIAMDSRDLIGQAKGILIERYKITGVEAFGLLVASSQAVNCKLREVADHLVATGELLTPSR